MRHLGVLEASLPPVREDPELGVSPGAGGASGDRLLEPNTSNASSESASFEIDIPPGETFELSVNHVLGAERMKPGDVHLLEASSADGPKVHLYRRGKHEEESYVTSIPDELSKDVYFVRADVNDVCTSASHEYMIGLSKAHVRLYVLFPSGMPPPSWLRAGFMLMRDRVVQVSWAMDIGTRLILSLGGFLEKTERQVLKVWQSKRVYHPGDCFALYGADGSGELPERQYVLAFRASSNPDDLKHLFARHMVAADVRTSQEITKLVQKRDTKQLGRLLSIAPARMHTFSHEVGWDAIVDQSLANGNCMALKAMLRSPEVAEYLNQDVRLQRLYCVAVMHADAELLMLIFSPQRLHLELTDMVLQMIIHHWAESSFEHDESSVEEVRMDVPQYLINYIIKRRHPLSITAAILGAVRQEMKAHEYSRGIMRLAHKKFHSLHMELLARLKLFTKVRDVKVLDAVMLPSPMPETINDFSPLQMAFDSNDLEFMSDPVMSIYIHHKWRGLELLLLTSHTDARSVSLFSPLIGHRIMHNLGFAGGLSDPAVAFTMQVWHCVVLTSTAFFDSPRGRWLMHGLCELVFLCLYQRNVLYPDEPASTTFEVTLLVFTVGNLWDITNYTRLKYGSLKKLRKYLTNAWNTINFFTNLALLGVLCIKLAQDFDALPPYSFGDAIQIVYCSLAPFVWIRALGMAVPIYTTLGPLVNTMGRMLTEIVAFVIPMFVVYTGFATMMVAVLSELLPAYGNYTAAMLTLFQAMLLQFDANLFSVDNGLTASQVLWANITLIVFLFASSILLMNLLIAIVSYRYRPEEVEKESLFRQAEVVDFYQVQVQHSLICSPFSIMQLFLIWMPITARKKMHMSTAVHLGLPSLDGHVLPDGHGRMLAGRAEFPHFVYLLTLHPIQLIIINVAFWALSPFCVLFFATRGRMKLLGRRTNQVSTGMDTGNLHRSAHQVAAVVLATTSSDVSSTTYRIPQLILWFLLTLLFFMVGGLVFVVLGVVILTLWSTLYVWFGKVVFSTYNFVGRGVGGACRAVYTLFRSCGGGPSSAAATQPHGFQPEDPRSLLSQDLGAAPSTMLMMLPRPGNAPSLLNNGPLSGPTFLAGAAPSHLGLAPSLGMDDKLLAAAALWHTAAAQAYHNKKNSYLDEKEVLMAIKKSLFAPDMIRWRLSMAEEEKDGETMEDQLEDAAEFNPNDTNVEDDEFEDEDAARQRRMEEQVVATMHDIVTGAKQGGTDLQAQVDALRSLVETLTFELHEAVDASSSPMSVPPVPAPA